MSHSIGFGSSFIDRLLEMKGGCETDAIDRAIVKRPREHLHLGDDDHLVGGGVQTVAHVVDNHHVDGHERQVA